MKGYVWFLTAVMLVFCATVAIPAHASSAIPTLPPSGIWTYAFNTPDGSYTLVLSGEPYGVMNPLNPSQPLSTVLSSTVSGIPSGVSWVGNGGTSNYTDTYAFYEVEVLLEYSTGAGTYAD
jgi:hypothetical protein